MHYKDGTEAKVGDRCRFPSAQYDASGALAKVVREGLVYAVTPTPGHTHCNAKVAYPTLDVSSEGGATVRLVKMASEYVTLGECEKAD